MRPQLSPEQAARYTRDEVLAHTGPAGNDRADPWSPAPLVAAAMVPDLIVGPGGHASVQQAVNAAFTLGRPVTIGILPGAYRGLAYIPDLPFPVTLLGLGARPDETLLFENIDAEMPGTEYLRRFAGQFADAPAPVAAIFRRIAGMEKITTANASVLRVENHGLLLLNLTIRNSYNADRPQPESTAMNPVPDPTLWC